MKTGTKQNSKTVVRSFPAESIDDLGILKQYVFFNAGKKYIIETDSRSLTRLFNKIKFRDDGVWEWTGGRTRQGYGQFNYKGKNCIAHRLVFSLWYGSIPDGLDVLHLNDTPYDCNPEHLAAGSAKANMLDAKNKGKFTNLPKRGKAIPAKEKLVILKKLEQGQTAYSIAKQTGRTVSTIQQMKQRYQADYKTAILRTVDTILTSIKADLGVILADHPVKAVGAVYVDAKEVLAEVQ